VVAWEGLGVGALTEGCDVPDVAEREDRLWRPPAFGVWVVCELDACRDVVSSPEPEEA